MKIIFSLILITSYCFGNELIELYNVAARYYNDKQYEKAEPLVKDLIEKKHDNPLIYFMLGKIKREQGKPSEAIESFEKFVNTSKNDNEVFFAKINIAYEYLTIWNIENLEKAKKIVDEIKKTEYGKDADFTFCFATVYNSYGFYLIKHAPPDIDWEYYSQAVPFFEEAVKSRPELPTIANNLAVSYIRIIENGVPQNLRGEYYSKAKNLLEAPRYAKTTHPLFKKTKNYFYSKIVRQSK